LALRDWSARRLGAAWIIGLVAQLALVGGVALYSHLTEPPEFRAARLHLDSLERRWRPHQDSIARGLRPPPPALTPEQKASFRAFMRDSVGITWETRGNVTTMQMPPALAAGVGRTAENLGTAVRGIFLLAAATLLPIPLGLLALTCAWLYVRRRSPPGVAAA
jgi:hypothetical protein